MRALGKSVVLVSLLACAPNADPRTGCDGLCGDGDVQAVAVLKIVGKEADGTVTGFDLDGKNGDARPDCRAEDYVAPDGTTGIDNRFVAILPVIEGFAGEAFPTLLQNSVNAGGVGVVVERVTHEGALHLVFRRAEGVPLLASDDRLLPGQTFVLAREQGLLGVCSGATVTNGVIECGPFDLRVSATIFQFTYDLHIKGARVRITDDPATGGTTMLAGGGIPVADVLSIASIINVDDLAELVADLIPPFADLPDGPDGECALISASVRLDTRPGFALLPVE